MSDLEARLLTPCIEDGCDNGVDHYTGKPCSLCYGKKWITQQRAQTYRHAMSYGNEPTWSELQERAQEGQN